MKEYLLIIIGVLAILLILFLLIKFSSKFRKVAYKLFVKAEKEYKSGEGQEKMEYVISNIHSWLPEYISMFIPESVLKKILQWFFDELKDVLDDGKFNESTK